MPQPEEPQLVQELPVPAMRLASPDSPLEKQAKVDSLRPAGFWQLGQDALSWDLLNGRNRSKFRPHSAQLYS